MRTSHEAVAAARAEDPADVSPTTVRVGRASDAATRQPAPMTGPRRADDTTPEDRHDRHDQDHRLPNGPSHQDMTEIPPEDDEIPQVANPTHICTADKEQHTRSRRRPRSAALESKATVSNLPRRHRTRTKAAHRSKTAQQAADRHRAQSKAAVETRHHRAGHEPGGAHRVGQPCRRARAQRPVPRDTDPAPAPRAQLAAERLPAGQAATEPKPTHPLPGRRVLGTSPATPGP